MRNLLRMLQATGVQRAEAPEASARSEDRRMAIRSGRQGGQSGLGRHRLP